MTPIRLCVHQCRICLSVCWPTATIQSRLLIAPWGWWWKVGWDRKLPAPELWGSSRGPEWIPENAEPLPVHSTLCGTCCGFERHHVGPFPRGSHAPSSQAADPAQIIVKLYFIWYIFHNFVKSMFTTTTMNTPTIYENQFKNCIKILCLAPKMLNFDWHCQSSVHS